MWIDGATVPATGSIGVMPAPSPLVTHSRVPSPERRIWPGSVGMPTRPSGVSAGSESACTVPSLQKPWHPATKTVCPSALVVIGPGWKSVPCERFGALPRRSTTVNWSAPPLSLMLTTA